MIKLEEEDEVFFDEAKSFLKEINEVVLEATKIGKKVVFATEDLLILSLEDDSNVIYEVRIDKKPFSNKLVYIGDKALKSSYLLNLIHKQELRIDPHYTSHI